MSGLVVSLGEKFPSIQGEVYGTTGNGAIRLLKTVPWLNLTNVAGRYLTVWTRWIYSSHEGETLCNRTQWITVTSETLETSDDPRKLIVWSAYLNAQSVNEDVLLVHFYTLS